MFITNNNASFHLWLKKKKKKLVKHQKVSKYYAMIVDAQTNPNMLNLVAMFIWPVLDWKFGPKIRFVSLRFKFISRLI